VLDRLGTHDEISGPYCPHSENLAEVFSLSVHRKILSKDFNILDLKDKKNLLKISSYKNLNFAILSIQDIIFSLVYKKTNMF
jgi:hypothetical protein